MSNSNYPSRAAKGQKTAEVAEKML